jgi:quinoprotein glucose dehydrogenase
MHAGQDPGGTKFSSLAQINTANVAELRRAWTFHTGDDGVRLNATPLVVDTVMYFATPSGVFALEADTGRQLWKYSSDTAPARRGVSYWPGDGGVGPRVLSYHGPRMLALDARTGRPVLTFGTEGFVERDHTGSFASTPPAIYKNLVITSGSGPFIDAYDIPTGRKVWTFHTIPQPGEPGHESWEGDSWKNAASTNVWGYISIDVERETVFLPVSQSTVMGGHDYYGGDRPGDNLYGDSLVALDANTGTLKWYQQMVRHDIWDYDNVGQPALIEVVQNGVRIPAVAAINKNALLFIYDRVTGNPVFGVEDRPVPPSTVPGEKASPTQPFPVKPLPFARDSMTREDLWDRTPGHAMFCRQLWDENNAYNDGPYTPYPLKSSGRTAVIFPGAIGGVNWGGVSTHPTLGLIFANVANYAQWGYLVENENPDARTPYRRTSPMGDSPARFRFWNPDIAWPCQKGPWGELVAINANTGDIAWRVPLGLYRELEAAGIMDVGTPNLGGSIATAGGLVFIAATVDSKFRAFDARTGSELWAADLEVPGHSIPTTYLGRDGKQYVAVVAGGGTYPGQTPFGDVVTAFSLP